jgi:tRNA threonylcarbamoyladenosine biosynthesis protein TsaB
MRYLAVDRSTRAPCLAVCDDGTPVFEHVWEGEPARAPEWLAELSELLKAHKVGTETLDAYVCGLGPGSFSGIRAGLAALSGLALPGARPVYGVASAAAIALAAAAGAELVTVIGDARRSRLWCVTYRVDASARRVSLADGRVPSHTADDFLLVPAETLPEWVPEGSRLVSPDWDRLEPALRSPFGPDRLVQRCVFPQPADLVALATGTPASRVLEPVPIYLHPAVASAGQPVSAPPTS